MIHTDPLSIMFISFFVAGLLFLIVSALLGGIGHGHVGGVAHHTAGVHLHGVHVPSGHAHAVSPHTGQQAAQQTQRVASGHPFSLFGVINPMSIAFFLAGFGLLGYAFHTSSFSLLTTLLLAGAGGLIIAALLLLLLSRLFGDIEGTSIQDVADRTGLLGKVSITIQPNSLGEIIYVSPGGLRKSIPARSINGRRLERDQEVVVVNYQRGVAEVDTWEHFVNQEPSETTPRAEEDELATLRALLDEPLKTDTENFMESNHTKE